MPSNKSLNQPNDNPIQLFSHFALNWGSKWPPDQLENTARVVVSTLEQRNLGEMLRHELRLATVVDIGYICLMDNVLKVVDGAKSEVQSLWSASDVYKDILFIQKKVYEMFPPSTVEGVVTQIVIDCKHFMNEWPWNDDISDEWLTYECVLSSSITHPLAFGELVVLNPYVRVGKLKEEAQNAMRETYCMMENFVVMELEGLEDVYEDDEVFCTIKSSA
ncbi:hypothetical protein NE237_020647 [Protea cynaroides]|uniref:Uncharacterized protein n=1 Tax=Protea cynaroides TaxID=273540 RepID=A0A9Q0K2S5_9MAGN|nr:hypothetical protein NE237_020647 [Protea cynaroides]